jgi:hypothetical protein
VIVRARVACLKTWGDRVRVFFYLGGVIMGFLV